MQKPATFIDGVASVLVTFSKFVKQVSLPIVSLIHIINHKAAFK